MNASVMTSLLSAQSFPVEQVVSNPVVQPDFAGLCIGIIGLGYVGLPLAVAFGAHFRVIGFDIDPKRIRALEQGQDMTREITPEALAQARHLQFSDDPVALSACQVFIVTVPTPIDIHKRPDFGPLESASRTVAQRLKPGDVVIYESTVYPGATEEICVPLLEAGSGLRLGQDFEVGYSPERINPGDGTHRLTDICKITSASSPKAADFVDALYRRIIRAGTHRAPSIRVAEAAKVIENTQRDVNIALVNELSLIFERLGLDTEAVLAAASTKWNFLPFRPGLVGGHCIGVDPYYLTHKAQAVGHHPEIILAGRRINDAMGAHVATRVVKLMLAKDIPIRQSRILILGLSFKENCPDLRNTRVLDIMEELGSYGAHVAVFDPEISPEQAMNEYGIAPLEFSECRDFDAIVIAVAHRAFHEMGIAAIRGFGKPGCVVFDVKYLFPACETDGRL
jgi:UDP-N-acetyl-D-glucosamine/UDP-N-acetyl-D-galactosamine dehydrogenase